MPNSSNIQHFISALDAEMGSCRLFLLCLQGLCQVLLQETLKLACKPGGGISFAVFDSFCLFSILMNIISVLFLYCGGRFLLQRQKINLVCSLPTIYRANFTVSPPKYQPTEQCPFLKGLGFGSMETLFQGWETLLSNDLCSLFRVSASETYHLDAYESLFILQT